MDSFADLSQISDISAISRISHSTSYRLMGQIDSLHNVLDYQSSTVQNSTKNAANSTQDVNLFDKITKSFTLYEERISEYAKAKVIFECVKECSLNKNKVLAEETIHKLQGLLQLHEIKKCMHLPSPLQHASNNLKILGFIDLPVYELSYEEKLKVKCYIETLLREKLHSFLVRYAKLGGNVKELQKSQEFSARKKVQEIEELQLMDWKDKLENICVQYENGLLQCASMINKWKELKYKDVNEIYVKKAEDALLESHLLEVKAKIVRLTCLIKMYTETPKTLDAYKTLNKILDEKLLALSNEIHKKENLKKLYLNLQNTKYDNILNTYLHLCNVIKKKKQILHML